MVLRRKCKNYTAVENGWCFRGFDLLIMQYSEAKYATNIEKNKMKLGNTKCISQGNFWFFRKYLFHSFTWISVLEND